MDEDAISQVDALIEVSDQIRRVGVSEYRLVMGEKFTAHANVVDGLFAIADALNRVATAIENSRAT